MSVFKILEINIISAQDLPPVSKVLRTFVVAYVHPDHKLTTRVDHQRNSNPAWNYKVSFHVDEQFLKSEFSVITFEIYNIAWLRDLPIGTTHLFINNLSPPLQKNPSFRRVTLQIRRPSGHLQGTLNLGVQLLDNTIPGFSEISSISRISNDDQQMIVDENEQVMEVDEDGSRKENDSLIGISKEEVMMSPRTQITSKIDDLIPGQEAQMKMRKPESEPETKTSYSIMTPNTSIFSGMKPLPSEVAEDMKKWLYSNQGDEYGSSIFENWTETGDKLEEHILKSKSVKWRPAEDYQITSKNGKKSGFHTKKNSNRKGLFSCFANAYGFQFSFICGSKSMKKNKKKHDRKKQQNFRLIGLPEEKFRRFNV